MLAGLVLSLYAGSVSGVMVLFNHDLLIGLFLWGAGFLDQQDWGMTAFLAPPGLEVPSWPRPGPDGRPGWTPAMGCR